MTITELLESRHETRLEWHEPRTACGPEGNEILAHVRMTATVHDCVNLARFAAKQKGLATMGDDARHLQDFMVANYAVVETQVKI